MKVTPPSPPRPTVVQTKKNPPADWASEQRDEHDAWPDRRSGKYERGRDPSATVGCSVFRIALRPIYGFAVVT